MATSHDQCWSCRIGLAAVLLCLPFTACSDPLAEYTTDEVQRDLKLIVEYTGPRPVRSIDQIVLEWAIENQSATRTYPIVMPTQNSHRDRSEPGISCRMEGFTTYGRWQQLVPIEVAAGGNISWPKWRERIHMLGPGERIELTALKSVSLTYHHKGGYSKIRFRPMFSYVFGKKPQTAEIPEPAERGAMGSMPLFHLQAEPVEIPVETVLALKCAVKSPLPENTNIDPNVRTEQISLQSFLSLELTNLTDEDIIIHPRQYEPESTIRVRVEIRSSRGLRLALGARAGLAENETLVIPAGSTIDPLDWGEFTVALSSLQRLPGVTDRQPVFVSVQIGATGWREGVFAEPVTAFF